MFSDSFFFFPWNEAADTWYIASGMNATLWSDKMVHFVWPLEWVAWLIQHDNEKNWICRKTCFPLLDTFLYMIELRVWVHLDWVSSFELSCSLTLEVCLFIHKPVYVWRLLVSVTFLLLGKLRQNWTMTVSVMKSFLTPQSSAWSLLSMSPWIFIYMSSLSTMTSTGLSISRTGLLSWLPYILSVMYGS